MTDSANGGRITHRMIYDRQEKLISTVHEMDKKQGIVETKTDANTKEIDALRKRSNVLDGVNAALIALGTYFGITK